jgi:ribulose-phosphate 3-epimerase
MLFVARTIRFAPSILAADFLRLGEQMHDAEAAGADFIHIDVMDGRFVPNLTMGPLVVEAARRAVNVPLDVHLMIVEPDTLIPAFAEAGAHSITVHWEVCPNLHRTLATIRSLGCQAGVALNPHTPASLLQDIVPFMDNILVMTVDPGFGGQSLIRETLNKVKQVRSLIEAAARGNGIRLTVDGGVNEETLADVIAAGADTLVIGSGIFNDRANVQTNLASYRRRVHDLQ